jgi:hypothetical protein
LGRRYMALFLWGKGSVFGCFGFEGWCCNPQDWCGIASLGDFYFYDFTWRFLGCDAWLSRQWGV